MGIVVKKMSEGQPVDYFQFRMSLGSVFISLSLKPRNSELLSIAECGHYLQIKENTGKDAYLNISEAGEILLPRV